MPNRNETDWMQVIGRALSYLCVQQAAQNEPKRVPDVPAKVKFLEGLGISTGDAAEIMGTTANSIKTNLRQKERNKGAASGKARKKN